MTAPRPGALPPLPPLNRPAKKSCLPRPQEVKVAVYLWVTSLVVGLVSSGVSFPTMHRRLDDDLHKQLASTADLATLDTGLIATIALVVVLVLGVALRTFLIVMLAAGRRWARTVLTALGVFSVLGAVLGVRSAAPVEAILSVLDALLIAGAVVYMFSEGAKAYFVR